MLPSDMNLRIGKVKNYKILTSKPGYNLGINLKINLDDEKDEPDVKSKVVEMVKTEPDVKPKVKTNIKLKQDVKKPDTDKITYEEEKVALILGITSVFTVWWTFK